MSPITKIWLCNLHPGNTVSDQKFKDIWEETLAFTNSYTKDKPSAKTREQHVLFQSESDATQLVLVTGYPSLEMNLAADREYVTKIAGRMSQFVKHDRLLMLEKDIDELPLETGRVSLSLATGEPAATQNNIGSGGWDVWQPPGTDSPPIKSTWVQVSSANNGDAIPNAKSKIVLKRIKGV
ncbi:hypothetical protein QQS21_007547 [Conoideocrella luteorostrata]|uniref:Uncharacterized protein n=1 Tax=Conoideocrella luteorostrata TaxID=1105319 RepID=A0AAJ0FWW9_9HYPO|nr:hypothetical protein QQS21_007547 [Conoideocrella luteorostrata]